MKRKLSFWLRIAIWIIPWLLRVINITIRFKIKGIENRPQDKNRIYALFHGQQAYFYGANDEEGIVVLTSRSRDGEILSQILIRLGFQVVRGSSSRGGTSGLLSLIKKAKKGHPVLIAVDGPKGPYHHVKEGIILLAQATGLPIIPLAASGSKKITIKSFYETYNSALEQYRNAGIELDARMTESILQQTWETVISQILWEQEIDRLGITVSDEELYHHLEANPPEFLKTQEAFLTDGAFDYSKYLNILKNPQGNEWLEIENYLRSSVLPYQKLNDIIISSVIVDENEILQKLEEC